MKKQMVGNDGMNRVSTFGRGLVFLLALMVFTLGLTAQAQAQRTLTIKNSNGQTAGVIELADNAQVDLRVTTTGITLGMPVGVSFSCTGTTTANGSCDATAGAAPTNNNGAAAVADADSDGVADSSDQCPNTPSGEFANSAGCSPSQLDDDKDGVSNATDQCANTPSGTDVNATGCPNQTTTASNSGAYCEGAPAGVTCSSNNNLDTWWENSGELSLRLNGDIVSLPFTTRDSSRDGGRVGFTTYESAFIRGEIFKAWVSETPGGKPLRTDTVCDTLLYQARGGLYWSQNPDYENYPKVCALGKEGRVLYLNFTACVFADDLQTCIGDRVSGYRFYIRRAYSPL